MTGIRLAPQATLTPWHALLIIVGTLVHRPLGLDSNQQPPVDSRRCVPERHAATIYNAVGISGCEPPQPTSSRRVSNRL